ncbi:hypothetical protein [Salininema proteolyticum]|uniref:Uncharacterized protein n=1 Tax=Salininema proteolyticum TaxID=1607685 RepID=A0ABV8U2B8_9ACTN
MMGPSFQSYFETAAGQAAAAARRFADAGDRFTESDPRLREARQWVRNGVDTVAGKFGYYRDAESGKVDDLADEVRRHQSQTNRMDAKLRRAQDDIAALRKRVLQLEARSALADDEKSRED